MAIVGIEGMTREQLELEVRRGGRFVVFLYCISVLIMTFRRGSEVHFLRSGDGAIGRGLPYTLLTLFLGWWGIPWGPIYTVQCLATNLGGGKDVTDAVLGSIGLSPVPASTRPR
jgi:hypothetical protein